MADMGEMMSTAEFLGITAFADGTHVMPMTGRLLGGRSDSLFGGAGLAAGVVALADVTGRPPVWMTGQYVSTISPPAELVLTTEELARGNSVSQGRVNGVADGRPIISLLGACGSRTEHHRGIWRTMPDAKSPEDSEPVVRFPDMESMHDHVEIRMARGMFGFVGTGEPTGDESSLLWARMPDVHHDAAALAIIADYMPSAVGNSLGHTVHCTSLDNTIRFSGPLDPGAGDEWILSENRIEFVGAGFANGTGLLWSQDGRLLATVSQSMTVSIMRD